MGMVWARINSWASEGTKRLQDERASVRQIMRCHSVEGE